jgi:hypothetical protein
MSDMAGYAARVAVEPSGSERDTIAASGSISTPLPLLLPIPPSYFPNDAANSTSTVTTTARSTSRGSYTTQGETSIIPCAAPGT